MNSATPVFHKYRTFLTHPVTLAVLTLLLGAAYGVALGLDISPVLLFGALVAAIGALLIFVRPEVIAASLLVIEWGYLSDIAVNIHSLPSITKPLAAILLAVIVFRRFVGQRQPLVADQTVWWMAAYLVVIAVGIWYAKVPDRTIEMVIRFAKEFVLFLIFINLIRSLKLFEQSIWALLALCALLGSLSVYQEVTGTFDNEYNGLARMKIAHITEGLPDRPRAAGTIGEPLAYGQQLLVLVPVGIWGILYGRTIGSKAFAAFATAACIAGIGLAFNRSTYLALAAVLGLYALHIRLKPKYLLPILPILIGLWVIAPPEFTARLSTLSAFLPGNDDGAVQEEVSFNRRSYEMLMAAEMFIDHPIIGVGGMNYRMRYQEYIRRHGAAVPDEERDPHSYYLEVAAEHGLIGLVAWGGILVLTWNRLRAAEKTFRAYRQQRYAELAVALRFGYIGYLTTALFLHGVFFQYLWLQVGIAVTLALIAQRYAAQQQVSASVAPQQATG